MTPATKDIYTLDPHTLKCTFTEVISQVTVTWVMGTSVTSFGFLNVKQGTYANHAQTSSLTLSSSQVAKLKTAGGNDPTHKITCKISVGDTPTDYTATHTAKIYKPGEFLSTFFSLRLSVLGLVNPF